MITFKHVYQDRFKYMSCYDFQLYIISLLLINDMYC